MVLWCWKHTMSFGIRKLVLGPFSQHMPPLCGMHSNSYISFSFWCHLWWCVNWSKCSGDWNQFIMSFPVPECSQPTWRRVLFLLSAQHSCVPGEQNQKEKGSVHVRQKLWQTELLLTPPTAWVCISFSDRIPGVLMRWWGKNTLGFCRYVHGAGFHFSLHLQNKLYFFGVSCEKGTVYFLWHLSLFSDFSKSCKI